MRPYGRITFFTIGRVLLILLTSVTYLACILEEQTASIYLTNDSLYDVVGVYYADAGTNRWSENLPGSPLPPGEVGVIDGIPREVVDIKIVFGDPNSTINITEQDLVKAGRINMTVSP